MTLAENILQRSLGPAYQTAPLHLGEASSQTGQLSLYNSSSVHPLTIQAGNSSAAVTYTLPTGAPAANGQVLTSTTAGVMSWSAAPALSAAFVTIGNDANLSGDRALTGTANQVIVTDNGANSSVVLSLPQNIATTSNVTFNNLRLNGKGLGINTDVDVGTGFTFGMSVLSTDQSVVELASSRADASGVPIGSTHYFYSTNTTNHKTISYNEVITTGATANQRGGRQIFYTKPNGSTTLTARLTIDSADPFVHIGSDSDTTNVSLRINGPSAGSAGALAEYVTVNINGTNRKIPCHAV